MQALRNPQAGGKRAYTCMLWSEPGASIRSSSTACTPAPPSCASLHLPNPRLLSDELFWGLLQVSELSRDAQRTCFMEESWVLPFQSRLAVWP